MKIIYSAVSDQGKLRPENQDSLFIQGLGSKCNLIQFRQSESIGLDKALIFAVFDGMGGESCGAQASSTAAKKLETICQKTSDMDLVQICMKLNEAVCEYMESHGVKSMGTTAAIICFESQQAHICNVGDSRIFKISGGKMQQLSEDHTMMIGLTSSRVLTQYLGIPPEEMVIEPHIINSELQSGDTFLICSDGLTDMVQQEKIIEIVSQTDPEMICDKLVETALENGGRDNVTAISCRIEK